MKNRTIFILLLVAVIARNLFPSIDFFLITTVLLLLLNRERISYLAIATSLAAIVYSAIFESPIGLFPLVFALVMFIFGSAFEQFMKYGIAPLLYWSFFIVAVLLIETFLNSLLSVGTLGINSQLINEILLTIGITWIVSFIISFKRKI